MRIWRFTVIFEHIIHLSRRNLAHHDYASVYGNGNNKIHVQNSWSDRAEILGFKCFGSETVKVNGFKQESLM